MTLKYQIIYTAINEYESPLKEALWQFLILPENNKTQTLKQYTFTNSEHVPFEGSSDGFGNETLRVHLKAPVSNIEFIASIEMIKNKSNPFEKNQGLEPDIDFEAIDNFDFKVEHEQYLTATDLTRIPSSFTDLFLFDKNKNIFENLLDLNKWAFDFFTFETEVTDTETTITEILEKRKGVCQDFTHVFCGIARLNGIPARYVSGYLHQGNNLVGDMQMHAWVECYLPIIGWVGFDPTNNLLVADNHIKVIHGRDYRDCAPLKGVVYLSNGGANHTNYTVSVKTVEEFDIPANQGYESLKKNYKILRSTNKNILQNQSQWQQQQ